MTVLISLCDRFSLWPFSFVAVLDVHQMHQGLCLCSFTSKSMQVCTCQYKCLRLSLFMGHQNKIGPNTLYSGS